MYHVAAKEVEPARASSLRPFRNQEATSAQRDNKNATRTCEAGPRGGRGSKEGKNNATIHSNCSQSGHAARRGELCGREGRRTSGRRGLRQEDQSGGLAGGKGKRRAGHRGRPDGCQDQLPAAETPR